MNEISQKSVLIVEDDGPTAVALTKRLTRAGYSVIAASQGQGAIEAAQRHQPDAITLDVRLPDVDGFEVAEALQQDFRTAGIPIVFLTGHNFSRFKERCQEAGARFFIRKPYDPEVLLLTLESATESVPEVN